MKKQKPYWEMNTKELAEATKEFDDPNYNPPAIKPTTAERAQLRRWQRKPAAARARLTLSLDKHLIAQTDDYAANHGIGAIVKSCGSIHVDIKRRPPLLRR